MGSYWAGSLKDAALKQAAVDTGRIIEVLTAEQSSLQRYATQWTQIATAVWCHHRHVAWPRGMEKCSADASPTFACVVVSMLSVLYLYQMHNQFDMALLIAATIAGIFTASFLMAGYRFNLPELFPDARARHRTGICLQLRAYLGKRSVRSR